MKRSIRIACLGCLLAATGAAPAAGTVELSWKQPEQFTDIGPGPADRTRHLAVLGQHLQALGRHLPEGRSLVLEVLDVDLAGRVEWHAQHQLRVLRDNGDGPRLKLRWRLLAGTSTLLSGEAWLSDLSWRSTPARQGELPHERQLIERWFQTTFVTP